MATTCPTGFDVAGLRAQVLATYERVARDPGRQVECPGVGEPGRHRRRYALLAGTAISGRRILQHQRTN